MQSSDRVVTAAGGAWNASLNHYSTGGNCRVTTQQVDEWVYVIGQDDFNVARYSLADLVPTPSDAAFERFLDERRDVLTYWAKLTPVSDALLRPQHAAVITSELAARLKTTSAQHGNAEVHLLLHMPFPLAVLTGRLTDTLRVALYEWEDCGPLDGDDYRPQYVPSINVRASAAGGVITQVLL